MICKVFENRSVTGSLRLALFAAADNGGLVSTRSIARWAGILEPEALALAWTMVEEGWFEEITPSQFLCRSIVVDPNHIEWLICRAKETRP